ncbi:MAG: tRNA 2-thiocytidine(32) synthetase TtcA [Clostridia bacterium]|nr:tRNA 2-thiocytidine(32) synthetase TtcA [Clostridia bacterium]
MKHILGYIRKAVNDFGMIEDGDKIAVGLSGGKDSILLLLSLARMRTFYPKKFELIAITLDMGLQGFDTSYLQQLCKENDVEYFVEKTHIAEIVFDVRQEKNPCSLCANLRRGILYDTAKKLGCNKVALGHHVDDVMETFLMSLLYEGRIHTFLPVTYLSRKEITMIRPMVYVPESEIRHLMKKYELQTVKTKCPADGETKRQYMKDLLRTLDRENSGVRESLFGAICRSEEWRGLYKKP